VASVYLIMLLPFLAAMILNFSAYDHQGKDYESSGKLLAKSPVAPKNKNDGWLHRLKIIHFVPFKI
jgi:hypothetical protein